jgi:hypothetical protein
MNDGLVDYINKQESTKYIMEQGVKFENEAYDVFTPCSLPLRKESGYLFFKIEYNALTRKIICYINHALGSVLYF